MSQNADWLTDKQRASVLRRLESGTSKEGHGGCWVWTRSKNTGGYGQIMIGHGTMRQTHRMSYFLLVGPIADGLQLDHLCRNRACCNPAHLEPVTCKENLARGEGIGAIHSRLTQCPKGHSYTPDNTRITKPGHRRCRECDRVRSLHANRIRRAKEKLSTT